MAQATFEDIMNPDLEASISLIVARDNDPWTTLARRNEDVDEEHPDQTSSAILSVWSSPSTVFSSRELSIVTKPTSYGTGYPIHDYKNKGKAATTYAASLSATHGSGSEAEVEHDDALHSALLGTGAWSSGHQAQGQLLRRHEHAKVRLSKVLPHRLKKPTVVLHHLNCEVLSDYQVAEPYTSTPPTPIKEGPRCLFHLIPRHHYVMFGLVSLTVLTVLLSALHLHSTDRAKMTLCKRTIFAATTLGALGTFVTVFAARRTLVEASLVGLFPLVFGSMVLWQLDSLA